MNEINEVNIRNGRSSDYENVVTVMPEWWGGRDLSSSVLKIFFIHFSGTTYIAEMNNELVGFLVGFMSQSEENVGYIHFAGVHPKYRRVSIGRLLFQKFYEVCKINNPLIESNFIKKTLFFVQIIILLTHEKIHRGYPDFLRKYRTFILSLQVHCLNSLLKKSRYLSEESHSGT